MLADTHCHLDLEQFDSDREAVIERARGAGVMRIMNPGIDLESSRRAVVLADRYREVYAAVGFHPHDAGKLSDADLSELRRLAQHPKVKAIGEIGLDYYRNLSPREAQQQAFRKQLALAEELNLPVIIHCREAQTEVMAVLKEWASGFAGARGVLHSYSGDRAQLGAVMEIGFHIGLTGPITFPKATEMRAVAASAPLEKILTETDAPYLTPAPHRGRRNEPAHVIHVAEKIAEVRGLTLDEVGKQTQANADLLFDWREER
ncbi:MAG TPA: TatD family hydrolase [Anaerolineales bacterium]|nr:TatD family hydrolase [Anaerolineales bacterium]